MSSPHRRDFLKSTAGTLSALTPLTATGAADQPNERIVLAVMGVHGRGKELIRGFSSCEGVDIGIICDPDENVIPAALRAVNERQTKPPTVEKDVRRVLENK